MKFQLCLLACVLGLIQAAENDCIIKGRGKLSQFSNTKSKIMIPCKYTATTFDCDGYKVHIAPTQAFDTKARYYTDNVMVSIEHLSTGDYWRGRTTARQVERNMNDSSLYDAWTTRGTQYTSSGMKDNIQAYGVPKKYSAVVAVKGTSLEVAYYGYEEGHTLRMNANGVRVYCKNPAFDSRSAYPKSMCGNYSDKALPLQTKDLQLPKNHHTIIHDVLNSEFDITNPTCEVAQRVFQRCNHKSAAVKACNTLLTKQNTRTCLDKNYRNPMDIFIYCIRYVCDDHREACKLMRDALEGCPKSKNLPGSGTRCNHKYNIKN